jgi:hypothetical protein
VNQRRHRPAIETKWRSDDLRDEFSKAVLLRVYLAKQTG